MRLMRIACIAGVAATVLAGCGDAKQTDYSSQNRAEFFAACTDPLVDTTLITRVCDCVFETAQKDLDYERFVAIENALVVDPLAKLAPEISQIVADCIEAEAAL